MTWEEIKFQALRIKGSQKSLACAIGISESALSKKFKGEEGWRLEELDSLLTITGHIVVNRDRYTTNMRFLKYTVENTETESLL